MPLMIAHAVMADAKPLEQLFRSVVEPLAIYSKAARADQLALFTAQEFARRIAGDPASVIVARLDHRLVGFAVVEDEHGPIWIEWYGVSPEAQGQGVGEQLIRFILADARRRGATRVWCDTRTDNSASNRVLARLGFRQLCVLPNHWWGQDFILWDHSPL